LNSFKNIIENPAQFSKIIVGFFFQSSKNCLSLFRELTYADPLSVLAVDILPINEEFAYQRVVLSVFERKQFFAQSGVKNVISMGEAGFKEMKKELHALVNPERKIFTEIVYLCGMSDQGTEIFKTNFFSSETNIPSDSSLLHNFGFLYPLSGTVIAGNKMGRTIGFPTANLQVDDKNKILPPMGVYTGWAKIDDNWHKTMINIGVRPTLNLKTLAIEAHILGFDGSLYGRTISLHLYEKIRNEKRFASLKLLKEQLEEDKLSTIKSLDVLNIAPGKDDFLIFA